MIEGKAFFTNEKETTSYILKCENNFESSLDSVADDVILKQAKIITICGPTCSGKTTTAIKLKGKLKAKGKNVHVLSFDDFYLDRDTIIASCKMRGVEVEYESASTLDLSLLSKVMSEIAYDNKTVVPVFDFKTGTRGGYKEYLLSEEDVFIFEGIQALYPEVSALYSDFSHYSIYICVRTPIKYNDNIFDTNTIRFLRRVVRDKKHRGTSAERTAQMWRSVRENEEANIFPNVSNADCIIDSSLAYEMNVIKGDVIETLSDVDTNSGFYLSSCMLLRKFDGIQKISEDYVPADSVLREFID